jgi:capsular exopolysaccharide synthesis family protein
LAKPSAALESLSTHSPISASQTSRGLIVAPRTRLRDRLAVLHRYRYLAFTVFVLVTTAIVMEASATMRRYQATTRLAIDDESAQPTTSDSVTRPERPSEPFIEKQIEILKGRDLARRTIGHIDLRSSPEYNDTDAVGDDAVRLDRFIQAVHVERLGPSRLVNLTFTALDSQVALRAVNALADQYVEQHRAQNARIVERAEVSRPIAAAISPWMWALALSCGLLLALVVPWTADRLSGKVTAPSHVIGELSLPLVGIVPSVRADKQALFGVEQVPAHFEASFGAIAAWLTSNYPAMGPKILAVTSASPFEGKTVTAANISLALARRGARVLLMDADMRQPGVHRLLRLPNERGLSQVLNGQARVRDVIQRSVDPNLLAITAGKTPSHASELLSSERMRALLATLSDGALDWIVIDTPPVLQAIDAVILAPAVTGFVYVARADMTRRRLAARALKTILAAGAGSVAVVLNKVSS